MDDIWKSIMVRIATAGLDLTSDQSIDPLYELVELLNNENALLLKIYRDVKAIKEGSYYSGVIWLSEAVKEQRTPKERISFIEKARDKFIDAYAVEKDNSFRAALATFQIATCWLLLNKYKDAKYWLNISYSLCQKGLNELDTQEVLKGFAAGMVVGAPLAPIALASFFVLMPTAVAAYYFSGEDAAEKVGEKLESVLNFTEKAIGSAHKFAANKEIILQEILNNRKAAIIALSREVASLNLKTE